VTWQTENDSYLLRFSKAWKGLPYSNRGVGIILDAATGRLNLLDASLLAPSASGSASINPYKAFEMANGAVAAKMRRLSPYSRLSLALVPVGKPDAPTSYRAAWRVVGVALAEDPKDNTIAQVNIDAESGAFLGTALSVLPTTKKEQGENKPPSVPPLSPVVSAFWQARRVQVVDAMPLGRRVPLFR
jgi:hypothetical protein